MSDGHSEAARIAREEAEAQAQEQSQAEEGGPPIKYGVSVFEMEDGVPVIHVTGKPDIGQLQRLLAGALGNLEADITARKVLQMMDAREQQQKILRPGNKPF